MTGRLLAALLSSLISIVVTELSCPPSSGPYQVTCPNRPILYLLDETVSFGADGFTSEVSFFRQRVVPITDWSLPTKIPTNKALADFSQIYPVTDTNDVCAALDQLEAQYTANVQSPSNNLYTMVETATEWARSIAEPATIVLFSSEQNKTEIGLAAEYVNKMGGLEIYTVVAMRGADFSEFPAKETYEVKDLNYPLYCLAYVLQQDACGDFGTCLFCPCPVQPGNFPQPPDTTPSSSTIEASTSEDTTTTGSLSSTLTIPGEYTVPTSPSTTAGPSSTIGATTTAGRSTESTTTGETTTPIPEKTTTVSEWTSSAEPTATSAPQQLLLNPVCECVYEKVWTDVVLLFDSSAATGDMGLQELWVSVQSWLAFFNVQRHDYKESSQFMQIGVIVYAGETQVVSHLGEWNGDDLFDQEQLPYLGGLADNLEGGIRAAMVEFYGANKRENSRSVIVLMATDYSPTNDPQEIANTFKEDGGILMVFNYLETHGEPVPLPQLKALASSGYFFDSRDNNNVDLQQAQCDAGCFCRPSYRSFQDSTRGYPTAGCYYTPTIEANFIIAERTCSFTYGGVVAVDESLEKTAFYRNFFPRQSIWINLIYNTATGEWAWYGQIPLNESYWVDGQTPDGTAGEDHAAMGSDGYWRATSPTGDAYYYICEIPPCDSTHYCA